MPGAAHLPRLRQALVTLVVVLFSAVPARAWAGFAVVAELSTPDAAGRWHLVEETPRAAVLRGAERVLLHRGDTLMEGDRIVTERARVKVDLGDGQDLSIAENSDVEVRPRSTLQRLGDVFYRVTGAFSVEYGTVQTAVEGTEFSVSGDSDSVRVSVAEGHVRVKNPTSEVHLRRWQSVDMPLTGPAPTVRSTPDQARAEVQRSFRRGAPLLHAGLLASGGLANLGGEVQGRAFARVLLGGPVRLSFDTGIGNNGAETGIRLPQGLGLDLAFGGVSVGGQVVATFELDRLDCDGAYAALHLGGMGAVRYQLPLSRTFSLDGEVRGGWVDGLQVDGAIGLGVSL